MSSLSLHDFAYTGDGPSNLEWAVRRFKFDASNPLFTLIPELCAVCPGSPCINPEPLVSLRNGDQARARKVQTKRRLRRSQIRLLRRLYVLGENYKIDAPV